MWKPVGLVKINMRTLTPIMLRNLPEDIDIVGMAIAPPPMLVLGVQPETPTGFGRTNPHTHSLLDA